MITESTAGRIAPWQEGLRRAVGSVGELLERLELPAELLPGGLAAAADFPLRVPLPFVERMRKGDPHDPLLLQVLPVREETAAVPGFSRDPLHEADASPVPGLVHKYHGRVLLVATGACAVHCRYCFRRHFPYAEHQPWGEGWRPALDYLAAHPEVEEVILSGGDPLSLSDDRLGRLVAAVASLPHVRRLRLHTRLPIVLPERVDDALCGWLAALPLQRVVVLHSNHPREIDTAVRAAAGRLRATGATVLNQSVLLAGVNDDAGTLAALSESLFAAGVLPYYLHLLDPVDGAAHFLVPEARARDIARHLGSLLPGYLVPRLVREQPGAGAKVPLGW